MNTDEEERLVAKIKRYMCDDECFVTITRLLGSQWERYRVVTDVTETSFDILEEFETNRERIDYFLS